MRLTHQRAVVCLSGGMDSCVTLAEALHLGLEVGALHLSYGQRTSERERTAFEAICDHYGIATRLIAKQPALAEMGGSALTDRTMTVPLGEPGTGIPVTYVPFRNGQILSLACAWAETLGAQSIWIGAVEDDSPGYPDCRPEFFHAFEQAVDLGTRPETTIRIVTPVLRSSKAEIVTRALELGAPLELTWSCYTEDDPACGLCESCRLRLRGFAAAGATDPIHYQVRDPEFPCGEGHP